MKVIIAGSRTYNRPSEDLSVAVSRSKFNITEVVSGGAKGADQCGEYWAWQNDISIKTFNPNWHLKRKYNPLAGLERNVKMADYADALIALWDGQSTGTNHMINEMKKRKKPVFIWRYTTE